jgi:hypothetical protein
MDNLPPLRTDLPPALPRPEKDWSGRRAMAMALSVFLVLFLVDAFLCLADDSLILAFQNHSLTAFRGIVAPLTLLATAVIYVLLGIIHCIPKRVFLPLTTFHPLAGLVAILFLIYSFDRMQEVVWAISLCQVVLSLAILCVLQDGFKLRWPILEPNRLDGPVFSWRNLWLFLLANLFILVPIVAGYLFFCLSRAVDHYSDGFVALRPKGLTVQVRKYVRSDGKTIELVPMSHIGETDFYRALSKSFPSNAIILMEGVSDKRGLLTNRISYKRMAASLGVTEQQREFKPARSQIVRADVDVEEFTSSTIEFINVAMLVHSKGLNSRTLLSLVDSSQPNIEQQIFNDVLLKRNRRVVHEIETQLAHADNIIVPWGAAHMPGIAAEIQKLGFHVSESEEYVAIRFGSRRSRSSRQQR